MFAEQTAGRLELTYDQLVALQVLTKRSGTLKLSTIGDSISTRDQPTTASGLNGPRADGIGSLTCMLSGGRFQLHTCRATGGMTIAQIASTHVPTIIADKPDVVFVLAGTNDTYTIPTPAAAATIYSALLTTIWQPLMDAGIVVVGATLPVAASRTTSITAVQRAAAAQLNALIRGAINLSPMLLISDLETVTSSGSGANEGAQILGYVNTEPTYLHPNESGSMAMASERFRTMKEFGVIERRPEVLAIGSPYSAGTNPRGAGSNASGTNKTTLNAGITGTGPDGWVFGRTGTSTAVVTPGAVPRDDQRDGQNVQVAVTIGANGEFVTAWAMSGSGLFITGSSSVALRQNSALYVQGERRRFASNGLWYQVLQPGTTAASAPASPPTVIGSIVADGTVVWMRAADLVAGVFVRTVCEMVATAHTVGNIVPCAYLKQYNNAYGNLAAGVVFEMDNGTAYTAGNAGSAWGTVYSHANTGFFGFRPGSMPLNVKLRLETPWVAIASDCGIMEPGLRIIGATGGQATIQISHLDMQIRA